MEGGRFSWLPPKLLLNCGGCLAGVEDGADCEPLIPNAAISCGSNGRDLRRVFWRRFWNQICKVVRIVVVV